MALAKRYFRGSSQAFSSMRRRYGGIELTMYTDQVTASIDNVRRRRLFEAATIITELLKNQVLVGPRTGRIYRFPRTNVTYQASAPGEPPAERTGYLRVSYDMSPKRWSDIDERVTIGTNAPYARILELALDRAHLMVAYERAAPHVQRILRAPYH